MLFLSPDEQLLQFEHFRIPMVPFATSPSMFVFWALPNMFVMPLAMLAWSGAFWTELRVHERTIGRVSANIFSDAKYQVDQRSLDELTKVGIRVGSLDVRLGLLERAFGQTIDAWSKNSLPDQKELGMPSLSQWPSTSSRDESQGGFLTFLGKWLRRDLDAMTRTIQSLERQVELLSRQANDAIMRRSTLEMENVTRASLKSQESTTTMTYVLVILTFTLVSLALLENGYLSYAAIGIASSVALAIAWMGKEFPRFRYLLVELVVVFVALQLWPSEWSWYWITIPSMLLVGFSFWWTFRRRKVRG
jgi:hypothetical protein